MKILFALILATMMMGCSSVVDPIEYGSDECHYCSMTIVEKQYASALVTDKGKTRKFDAVECLVNFIHENPEITANNLYVNVFDAPGKLVDATSCSYLISPMLPSPMGANLTAFSNMEQANAMLQKAPGKLYSWSELLALEKP
ncbi:MAG: nitrous oxide reductase accessory protein NosL [Bacteroidetes bacterium]|nr:nitrous oxide reductase accessory protein NosL [Bacteroidales bacterium]MBU1010222.1 nitrous oxide reductase accessory protein NosL [Bacteroidota bacterium]